jgi:hypothetical protein
LIVSCFLIWFLYLIQIDLNINNIMQSKNFLNWFPFLIILNSFFSNLKHESVLIEFLTVLSIFFVDDTFFWIIFSCEIHISLYLFFDFHHVKIIFIICSLLFKNFFLLNDRIVLACEITNINAFINIYFHFLNIIEFLFSMFLEDIWDYIFDVSVINHL